jgi:hypothetical protein
LIRADIVVDSTPDRVGGHYVNTQSRVVVRFRNGQLLKGYTLDFMPNRDVFHVIDPDDDRRITEVSASELKAVFHVTTFEGTPGRPDPPDFSKESLGGVTGLKLKVSFSDGEVMFGTTNGYSPGRKGFFIFPADETSNNERVYVYADSTTSVESWR